MSYDIRKCEHIKTNRARRDFPHRTESTGGANTAGAACFPAGEDVPRTALDIPFPEDADAIQYGLGKVIYGLLNGLIDHKSAGLVLYALQTASGNLKNTSLFKRSQQADEEDRSNVSPLLAYYLGPSRENYSRVLRILQEAEADLNNKTREIAALKQRLGEPCEEDAAPNQSSWVERMHEASSIEPREERYPRNEDIHSAYAARRSAGLQSDNSQAARETVHIEASECAVEITPADAERSAGASSAVARRPALVSDPPRPPVRLCACSLTIKPYTQATLQQGKPLTLLSASTQYRTT